MPYLPVGGELGAYRDAGRIEESKVPKKSSMSYVEVKSGMATLDGQDHHEQNGVACLLARPNGHIKVAEQAADRMDGVEHTSFGPPANVQNASRPKLRRAQAPERLWPFVPPPNFGAVKDYEMYRSGYPEDDNLEFLETLHIKKILTLVDTRPSKAYAEFIRNEVQKQDMVLIAANKDGDIHVTTESMAEALLVVLDRSNYPLYIHCNRGKHRTGCVVACLRKIQKWPLDEVLAEYDTYASPKARPDDIAFITSFDPESVYAYAKSRGFLVKPGLLRRIDSTITNMDMLAEALSSNSPHEDESAAMETNSSNGSVSSGLLMAAAREDVFMDGNVDLGPNLAPTTSVTTIEGVEANEDESLMNGVVLEERPSASTDASSLAPNTTDFEQPIVRVRSLDDEDSNLADDLTR